MLRYHKDVYIPEVDTGRLEAWTARLNAGKWQYSRHCTENLKLRIVRLEDVLIFIKAVKLNAKDIFEYYTDENNSFVKVCYRIAYTSGVDIILVIGEDKNIITIYMNEKNDLHYTLNKSLYVRN